MSSATILLVDDEAYVRESLAELLARRGYDVRTAAGGDEVLASPDLIEGCDLVVTDLRMPGVDGRELTEALATRAPQLPVIVSVSAPSALAFDLCQSAGATLVGFARGERHEVYCGGERLVP